jgi:hypothetical protein
MQSRHRFRTALAALAATAAATTSLVNKGGGNTPSGSQPSLDPVWLEPAPAPTLSSQPVLFRWTAVPGADRYRLRVGTVPGERDVLNLFGISATTHRAEGELPAGRPLYARVSAHRDGQWRHANLRFTVGQAAAEWIHPAPGSPVAEPGRAFEWTPVPGAREYRLVIGTSPGLADVLDRRVGQQTRVAVPNVPVGRRLIARVHTRIRDTWRWRDSDFALLLEYRATQPIYPRSGETADLGRPFSWEPAPLATGYRLRIGSRPAGSELHDSGVLRVTSRFVEGLPAGRKLFATLTTVYADRSSDYHFEFHAHPGTPTESRFVQAALAATAEVRAMAGFTGAWPRTLLEEVVRSQGVSGPGCVEFALTLLRALAEQGNRLPSRILNTCLLGNLYDCHTLVEFYRPSSGAWMVLDPTFAVAARRGDGEWATATDISDAARREHWTGITFVSLDEAGISRLRSYYIDYPLLFVSPFGQAAPRAEDGPAILRYYEEVALPVRETGSYAIRCLDGSTADVLIDGRPTVLTCQGRDRLSEIRRASSIEVRRADTIQAYRPRRFLF